MLPFLVYDAELMVFWWAVSVGAYWIGFFMIYARRPLRPTRMDDFFVRWGSPILLMLVTPLTCILVEVVRKRL